MAAEGGRIDFMLLTPPYPATGSATVDGGYPLPTYPLTTYPLLTCLPIYVPTPTYPPPKRPKWNAFLISLWTQVIFLDH